MVFILPIPNSSILDCKSSKYVEALFSNEDDFYKALEHSDDPLLRHRWAWAIEFDTYSRKVRKEYLEEILKKVEEKPGEDDRRIKRAINKALAR